MKLNCIKNKVLFIIPLLQFCCCSLFSCSSNYQPTPPTHISCDIETNDKCKFSYYTIDPFSAVQYPIHLTGSFVTGDFLQVCIIHQKIDDKPCSALSLSDDSIIFQLSPESNLIPVNVIQNQWTESFFVDRFSLLLTIVHNSQIIYMDSIDSLTYINGSPTPSNVFKFDDPATQTVLASFKKDDISQDIIKKCTILMVPRTVERINGLAFYDAQTSKSLIPSNIKNVILDEDFYIPDHECNLKEIGRYSFESAEIESITFPHSLIKIENNAFQDLILTNSSLVIPNSVSVLEYGAFYGAHINGSLEFENGSHLNSIAGFNFISLSNGMLQLPQADHDIVISQQCFEGSNITGISFTKNISELCNFSFSQCSQLSYIDLTNTSPHSLGISDDDLQCGQLDFENISNVGTIRIANLSWKSYWITDFKKEYYGEGHQWPFDEWNWTL